MTRPRVSCVHCGAVETRDYEFGYASWVSECPRCATISGFACSSCGYDGGNGVPGGTNCCGAPWLGDLPEEWAAAKARLGLE